MLNPVSAKSNVISVAVIVPDTRRRRRLVEAFAGSQFTIAQEFAAYPSQDDLPEFALLGCKVVIVDLDDEVEQAIRVIENICRSDISITVMAYSSRNGSTLMRQSMQAGAREFLVEPLLPDTVRDVFARTSARCPNQGRAPGKTLLFMPSKGGVGVTTVALNFALALTKESGLKVVVVDMDFQLGEIALGLGMTPAFSVVDALRNPDRLDQEFLSTLLLRHVSGLSILSSHEGYEIFDAPAGAAAKLFGILRDEFDYVVVDAGSCRGHIQETLLEVADTVYLVTGMNLPAIRHAHRLIAFLSARPGSRGLEVVLNRFDSSHGIDEKSTTRALGLLARWKIPNAYKAARAAEDSGDSLALNNSPVAQVLVQMAKVACGKSSTAEKKPLNVASFFGLRTAREQAQMVSRSA